MNVLGERLLTIVMALGLSACAATTDEYARFAQAGSEYTAALNGLLVVARDTAIDQTSAQLISENKSANRKMEGFYRQEIGRLEAANDDDLERIKVFSDIQEHTLLLNRYFSLLHELATSEEAEATAKAIDTTATNINKLTQKLKGQGAFVLTDDVKKRISTVAKYAIQVKQRAALKRRIEADAKILQEALQTHEALLRIIGGDLAHELKVLRQSETQWLLNTPFTAKKPLAKTPSKAKRWMADRRRILTTQTVINELATAKNAASTLKQAFKKLVEGDRGFSTVLNALFVELQSIRNVIDALQGGR